jgi:transposase InsO family protein
MALHPAGQAAAERVYRELQRPAERRMPERTIFSSLAQARSVLATWRHDYNHRRPHSSLGNMTHAGQCTAHSFPSTLPIRRVRRRGP